MRVLKLKLLALGNIWETSLQFGGWVNGLRDIHKLGEA